MTGKSVSLANHISQREADKLALAERMYSLILEKTLVTSSETPDALLFDRLIALVSFPCAIQC